jgi:hypothetical protein
MPNGMTISGFSVQVSGVSKHRIPNHAEDVIESQLNLERRTSNIEHRTSNMEHPILMALRFVYFKTS